MVVFGDYIIIMKLHLFEVHSGITKLFIALLQEKLCFFFCYKDAESFF